MVMVCIRTAPSETYVIGKPSSSTRGTVMGSNCPTMTSPEQLSHGWNIGFHHVLESRARHVGRALVDDGRGVVEERHLAFYDPRLGDVAERHDGLQRGRDAGRREAALAAGEEVVADLLDDFALDGVDRKSVV